MRWNKKEILAAEWKRAFAVRTISYISTHNSCLSESYIGFENGGKKAELENFTQKSYIYLFFS